MKCSHLVIFIILFACVAVPSQTPVVIENELHEQLELVSKYGNYGGDYDENKLTAANDKIKAILVSVGKRSDILNYPFPNLKDDMFIATSKDGRLRVYSWDYGSGGSMHDFAAVYQFKGGTGRVHVLAEARCEDLSECGAGSFVHDIFQVSRPDGPVYLLVSTFIGSTSLSYQSIGVTLINGEKLDRRAKLIRTTSGMNNSVGFEYDFFSVVDRPERPVKLFYFDEARRSFRFPVVIEDEKTPQGRATDKFITYSFNGKYFVRQN